MFFDAIGQAFLMVTGTSCVSITAEHTASISANCGLAQTTHWQLEAISQLLEKPTAMTEQLLGKCFGQCSDSAGEHTTPVMHTADKGKAAHTHSEHSSGASIVTALVFRGPPHTSWWLPQLLPRQGGWEGISRLTFSSNSQWDSSRQAWAAHRVTFSCGDNSPLQSLPLVCFRCLH